jgi:hypothetical protein
MRSNSFEHISQSLRRFVALAEADAEAPNAVKAAETLARKGITKQNGRPFSGQDVRMWRVKDKSLTPAQRTALMQAHEAVLAGDQP